MSHTPRHERHMKVEEYTTIYVVTEAYISISKDTILLAQTELNHLLPIRPCSHLNSSPSLPPVCAPRLRGFSFLR